MLKSNKTYNLTIIIIIRLQFVMICSRQHSFSIYLDWLMVSLSARCWVRLYSLSLETLSVQWIPSICLYDVVAKAICFESLSVRIQLSEPYVRTDTHDHRNCLALSVMSTAFERQIDSSFFLESCPSLSAPHEEVRFARLPRI